MQGKNCKKCGSVFYKKYNYSMAYWYIKTFCSIRCAKLGKKQSSVHVTKRVIGQKLYYEKNPNDLITRGLAIKANHVGCLGKHWKKTEEQLENKRGIKNPAWKGGITPINYKIRNSQEYTDWRISVFKRDNYTCQECNGTGITLNADHIKPFALFPELRLVIENGRTLCVPCHRKTDTYGGRVQMKKENLFVTL
jgi:hypothetical protein